MAVVVGSRAQRWAEALTDARQAQYRLEHAADEISCAMDRLKDLQCEYSDWLDNMPDYTQDGPTGEKLSYIRELDFDGEGFNLIWLDDMLDEAEMADLP